MFDQTACLLSKNIKDGKNTIVILRDLAECKSFEKGLVANKHKIAKEEMFVFDVKENDMKNFEVRNVLEKI